MKKDGIVLLTSVVGAILAIIIIGLGLSFAPIAFAPAVPTPTPGGLLITNAHIAREFELTSQSGQVVHLSDLRGKVVMLFFGYTHCPDVCPLTLADFKRVKMRLASISPDLLDKVTFVMISVDGERDTPEVMRSYVNAFDTSFIGLTGTTEKVAYIGLDYGVKFEKQKPAGTEASYLVAHTSFTYLIDAQGAWRVAYPFQTAPELIASEISLYTAK